MSECRELIDKGYKEITLLGQNVNSYGNGTDYMKFPQLLEKIAQLDGKFRLRFMTSHPKDFSEDLVKVIADNPKICRCVHLPVQSGSDRILKAMNRKYTSAEYHKKIDVLRKYIPECCITTDLIVGFPTETEEDFQATLELVKKVGYSSAFTFVYSKRKGTVAAEMQGQIEEEVSKNRIMRLIELVNSQTREQTQAYIGKSTEILCEGYDEKKKMYLGRDEFGRMGYFSSQSDLIGEFVRIQIQKANGISLLGERI